MNKQQPKIMFLTSGHSPFSARLYFRELKSLQKKYRELSIIAPFKKKFQLKQGIRIIGIRKRRSRYNRFSTLFDLYRKGLKSNPDVLHCHEPDSLFVSLIIKRQLKKVKIIYDCHEFHPLSFTEKMPRFIQKSLIRLIENIENFMATNADAIITVNNKLGNRFKKLNRHVAILPNYPPLAIFNHAERTNGFFAENCVHFIYVGGLSAERGLFKMVDVLNTTSFYTKCRLTLIGKFSTNETKVSFWKYADKLNVSKIIDYKGYLPHLDIINHLFNSDIGLCFLDDRLRYQWSEPIKYFEYSAAGLPVILSDLPAMKNLINTNKNGYVASFKSLVETGEVVRLIIANKYEATKMGERGQVAFKEKYNWEALEPRLFNLYSNLI